MAEEAGSYDVFAGGVYGFFHCPAHTLSYITALIVCVQVAVRYECFHTPVAGTDKCEYRVEKRIVEQCTTHFYGFLIGVEVIYIYHYESGRRCEEFTVPADECAARSHVWQQGCFRHSYIFGAAHLFGQCFEIFIAGDHLIYLLY